MTRAFYVQDGDRFVSTGWTRGPWSLDAQHGGPPAALLGRAFEQLPSDVPMRVSRFTIEILKPVPIVPLTVSTSILRPGKRVQLCEGALLDPSGDPVALSRAWRIRRSESPVAPAFTEASSLPDPLSCPEVEFPPDPAESYMHGMEWRTAKGTAFDGPSTVWFRMRVPLVLGEEPSPLVRTLIAADCGNGISRVLDFNMFFINVDLSVHLATEPAGEWVALEAQTTIDVHGAGLATTTLWDQQRKLGVGAQSLYVGSR